MKISKIRSLYNPTQSSDQAEWIREWGGYAATALPLNVDGLNSSFNFFDYRIPIVSLKDATILGGYPLSKNGDLWIDGVTYYRKMMEIPGEIGAHPITKDNIGRLFSTLSTGNSEIIPKAILIGGRQNFGHFLFEFLPKFCLFSLDYFIKEKLVFLVHESTPPRFLSFIELLGFPLEKIRFFGDSHFISVESLIVPGVPAHRQPGTGFTCFDRDLFVSMVSRIRSVVDSRASAPIKSLPMSQTFRVGFSTRQKDRWRRIINEKDILQNLSSKFPIELLEPASLNAEEQVRLFSSLDAIIDPIGGSSPAVMFSKPGTSIIELTTPLIRGDWGHLVWAALFKLNLFRVQGSYLASCRNDGFLPIDRDFHVPTEKLIQILSRIREPANGLRGLLQ